MARVSNPLLLVGSLPAASADEALRAGGELFGDLVFALPDGETGERSRWVGYERKTLLSTHPDLVVVPGEGEQPASRHVYEAQAFRLRPGTTALRFGHWPRADEAIASYELFRNLRSDGVIPSGLRFQVGLPLAYSVLASAVREPGDYAVAERAYEDLVSRELTRLMTVIPPGDLAVQWDVCFEVLDIEGVTPWQMPGAWDRFAGPAGRLARLVPEETLMGFHLCYGTFPEWPMYEARDMSVLVRMANYVVANAGRPVDWLHMAGPRLLRSEDDSFFRPLADLEPQDARVYLGIVQPVDGIFGLRRRHATASRHLADFGVSMYCGFGRLREGDGAAVMREHRDTIRALLGDPPAAPQVPARQTQQVPS